MSAALATMRSLALSLLVGTALLSAPAHAAEPPAIPRIGVLVVPLMNSPYEAGLRDGLRELGYTEGKNIVIEWRRSAGAVDDQRSFVADLARSNLDVIVVFNTTAARAAVEATRVPVVFLSADPLGSGLAASLARPGGRATGFSLSGTELTAKRLELLHHLAPGVRRIGCLMNSSSPVGPLQFEEAQRAARTLGIQLVKLDARNDAELDAVLRALPRSSADAIIVTADLIFFANEAKVATAIRKARLPAMFPTREYLVDGALMSYGPSLKETARKIAVYVDKILKGAKPADLPIEQVSKYELVIELRAARQLGIKVPQELLLRADEVIR